MGHPRTYYLFHKIFPPLLVEWLQGWRIGVKGRKDEWDWMNDVKFTKNIEKTREIISIETIIAIFIRC